jgi:hypothetical protein
VVWWPVVCSGELIQASSLKQKVIFKRHRRPVTSSTATRPKKKYNLSTVASAAEVAAAPTFAAAAAHRDGWDGVVSVSPRMRRASCKSARRDVRGVGHSTLQMRRHTSRHNRDAAGVNSAKVNVLVINQTSAASRTPAWRRKGINLKRFTK